MKNFLTNFINSNVLILLLLSFPIAVQSSQIGFSFQQIESVEKVEAPNEMIDMELNELLGEDPYLGQTSYLQSPDGFNQREKSK